MKPSWLTDEQQQLRDMMLRLAADPATSFDRFAELGIMSATIAEAHGGLGFGLAEATIIAEALGRGRSTLPFVETVSLAASLIAALGTPDQRNNWLPAIAQGRLTVAPAFAEAMQLDPLAPQTTSRQEAGDFVLNGAKTPVRLGDADLVLISACHGDGVSLHLVQVSAVPITGRFEMVDGIAGATITMNDCKLAADTLLGPAGGAGAALRDVLDRAIVVQAAEQTGIMAHLINATIDYLRQRKQFGIALADFQVLQHRVADMILIYEQAVSMVVKARLQDGGPEGLDRGTATGAALLTARAALQVGHEAIQLHGGMGVTEELSIGPAVKRIYALETRLCNIERLAAEQAARVYGSPS